MKRDEGKWGEEHGNASGAGVGSHLGAENTDTSSTSDKWFTLNQGVDALGFGKFQWSIFAMTGLLLSADACEMMLLSFLGPVLRCQWGLGPEQAALMTTLVFLGATIGAYMWGRVADLYGRRFALRFLAFVTFTLGIVSALMPDYGSLLLTRGLLGLCLGGFGVAFSMFMELVPTESRGRHGAMLMFAWTFGVVIEAFLGWVTLSSTKAYPESLGWRWLVGLSAAPVLVALIGFFFIPESPRYLLVVGRTEEAFEVLKRGAEVNKTTLPEGRLLSLHQMEHSLPEEHANNRDATSKSKEQENSRIHQPRETAPASAVSASASASLPERTKGTTRDSDQGSVGSINVSPPNKAHGATGRGIGGVGRDENEVPDNDDIQDDDQGDHYDSEDASSFMGVIRTLLGPNHRRTTLLLWYVWFSNSVLYYGITLMTSALQVELQQLAREEEYEYEDGANSTITAPGPGSSGSEPKFEYEYEGGEEGKVLEPSGEFGRIVCDPDTNNPFTGASFGRVLLASFSEVPGLLFAMAFVDRIGRRKTQFISFSVCALGLALMTIPHINPWVETGLLFTARASINSAFTCTWVFTPELYPTSVRTTAFGVANGFSRIGGMITPFIAQSLLGRGMASAAETIYCVFAITAAIAALCINVETANMEMQETEEEVEGSIGIGDGEEGEHQGDRNERDRDRDHNRHNPSSGSRFSASVAAAASSSSSSSSSGRRVLPSRVSTTSFDEGHSPIGANPNAGTAEGRKSLTKGAVGADDDDDHDDDGDDDSGDDESSRVVAI